MQGALKSGWELPMFSHHYREQVAKTPCGAVGLSEVRAEPGQSACTASPRRECSAFPAVGCVQHDCMGTDSMGTDTAFLAWGPAARNISLSASSHQAAHIPTWGHSPKFNHLVLILHRKWTRAVGWELCCVAFLSSRGILALGPVLVRKGLRAGTSRFTCDAHFSPTNLNGKMAVDFSLLFLGCLYVCIFFFFLDEGKMKSLCSRELRAGTLSSLPWKKRKNREKYKERLKSPVVPKCCLPLLLAAFKVSPVWFILAYLYAEELCHWATFSRVWAHASCLWYFTYLCLLSSQILLVR